MQVFGIGPAEAVMPDFLASMAGLHQDGPLISIYAPRVPTPSSSPDSASLPLLVYLPGQ